MEPQWGAEAGTQPFLAIGIISAPEFIHRRTVIRRTWLTLPPHPQVSHMASFAVRSGGAPTQLLQQLLEESQSHGDVILMNAVAWNETRLRGPVLTLAAWLRHVAVHLYQSRFVAKVDDDSYLHAPDLAMLLRSFAAQLQHPYAYIGTITWYSWFAKQWDRCGFGWTWRGSENMGRTCRNATWSRARCLPHGCGSAVGPFPFAAGYLIVLTTHLAAAIANSPDLGREEHLLQAASRLVTHKGFRHTQIFEDVWLGSFVHRFVSRPITWVQLFRSGTVVDLDQTQWGATVRPSALLVHIRSKEPRIFLAVDDFLRSSSVQGCRQRDILLSCRTGCSAFGVPERSAAARLCLPFADGLSKGGTDSMYNASSSSSASCRLVMRSVQRDDARARSFHNLSCAPVNLKPLIKSQPLRERAARLQETDMSSSRAGRDLRIARGSSRVGSGGGRSDSGGDRAWRAAGGQLQAWLHVAQLRNDGSLDIPNDARIVLEIGANSRNTLDRELLHLVPQAFLLSFEPLLDKYATLLSRASRPDVRTPLGHHHTRGITLPFAISAATNKLREFKLSGRTDGCASLLDPVSSYYSSDCMPA